MTEHSYKLHVDIQVSVTSILDVEDLAALVDVLEIGSEKVDTYSSNVALNFRDVLKTALDEATGLDEY